MRKIMLLYPGRVSGHVRKRSEVKGTEMWECLKKEITSECITMGVLLVEAEECAISGQSQERQTFMFDIQEELGRTLGKYQR
jgi:hypothetical protein